MRKLNVLEVRTGFSNSGVGRPHEVSKRECSSPAARPTTFTGVEARLHWPLQLAPHAAGVPSVFRARLWAPPAATATTLLSPGCGLAWPWESSPHPTTVPSIRSARL